MEQRDPQIIYWASTPKRETDEHILNFDLRYDRKSANSIETAPVCSAKSLELLLRTRPGRGSFTKQRKREFKDFDVRLSYDRVSAAA